MKSLDVCGCLKSLMMINFTLEISIDLFPLPPHDKVIKSMRNLQPQVRDWTLDVYDQLAINTNVPGFMEIDITKETTETLFKKLQLQHEFLDFVNVSDYYDKSIELQSKLANIVFQMNQLSLDDDDIHVSFFECAQPYSDTLVELLEQYDQ